MADKDLITTLDDLKARLRPVDRLRDIDDCSAILEEEWRSLRKNQIDALNARINLNLRLLNKVWPDLKSVDNTHALDTSKVQFVINRFNDKGQLAETTLLDPRNGVIEGETT